MILRLVLPLAPIPRAHDLKRLREFLKRRQEEEVQEEDEEIIL